MRSGRRLGEAESVASIRDQGVVAVHRRPRGARRLGHGRPRGPGSHLSVTEGKWKRKCVFSPSVLRLFDQFIGRFWKRFN